MWIHNAIKIATDFKDELSAVFGAVLEYMIVGKKASNKLALMIFIVVTTIFVLQYIIDPIIIYFKLSEPYTKVLYAFGGLFGIEIFSLIVTLFPKAIKHWVYKKIGVDDDN